MTRKKKAVKIGTGNSLKDGVYKEEMEILVRSDVGNVEIMIVVMLKCLKHRSTASDRQFRGILT